MTLAAASLSPKGRLWPILVIVGLMGLFATAWVTREIAVISNERLGIAFIHDARQRADHVVAAYDRSLKQLAVLQRLFYAVGDVDWPLFRRFVDPVVGRDGVADYGWAPLVLASEREAFEQGARAVWGDAFAVREAGGDGESSPAVQRERYFPLLYSLAAVQERSLLGLDLLAPAKHLAPISVASDFAASSTARSTPAWMTSPEGSVSVSVLSV